MSVGSATAADAGPTVWTIGHSTRSAAGFIEVLHAHGIELVADVRRFPGSRRLPQFGQEVLEASLDSAGIGYHWFEALGGRRRATAADDGDGVWRTDGWRHAAFRAYAAHAASAEFGEGLGALLDAAHGLRTALMCAEVLWWRCHRRLIADVLVATGHPVLHIRDATPAEPHRLSPPARLARGRLTYAAPTPRTS